ncbi:MAG: SelB domain-containing protein, partial [Gemmatimonadota bacterium]
EDDLFRLPVDRAFIVKGAGTVVTGSVWSGTVRRGDRVRLLPSGDSTRIRAIQVHGEERQQAGTGMRCALSLAGLALNQSGRGETVVRDEAWHPTHRFGARLRMLSEPAAGLEHGDRVRLYHGTKETTARVLLGSQGSMAAGDRAWAVLSCADPLVVRARDRFVIRSMSPLRTIGGGVVAYLDPGRRWREQVGFWDGIIEGDRQRAEDTVIFLSGGSGLRRADIPLRTGLPAPSVDRLPPTDLQGDLMFAPSAKAAARDRILDVVRSSHADRPRAAGVSLESVRAAVATRFASVLVESELAKLETEGTIVREGPEVRLRGHSVQLTERETESLDRIAAIMVEAGLAPPPPDRLSELTGIERSLVNDLLKILVASERLIQVNPEIYLSAEAEARLRAGAFKVLECESPASPAAFGEEFGLSRRLLIPLLEYLDRLDVTRRTAEGRVRGDI